MKRVSLMAGASVSGEVAASRRGTAGSYRGMGPPPTSEPQRAKKEREQKQFGKAPTSEQWTIMAGSMYNAIDHLRTFAETLDRAIYISEYSSGGDGSLTVHKSEAAAMQAEILIAVNMLRSGLKARTKK